MDELKKLFNRLQTHSKSMLFIQDKLNDNLLKKLKNSKYKKDKEFTNRFDLLVDKKTDFNKKNDVYSVPIKAEYVKISDDIDCSTLYSIDAPFDLLHTDVGDLQFLGKFAPDPKYCLLLVDLFASKVYVYRMKNRSLIPLFQLEKFYKKVANKRKNKKIRLQTDLEFKQKKIYNLNKKYNVEMFSTAVRGGKAFAAEQKL